MGDKNVLENLGSLGEFNTLGHYGNSKKFAILYIDSFNYGLLIYTVKSCRITFIKLTLKGLNSNVEDNLLSVHDDNLDKEYFQLFMLNVFCLPFALYTIICTEKNIWAVGEEAIVDLKPYIEKVLEKVKSDEDDDVMDVDDTEEFHPHMFDIEIKVQHEKYDHHAEDLFLGCNFIDNGIIRCYRTQSAWKVELLLSDKSSVRASDEMKFSFLDFPISFHKSRKNITSDQGQEDACKPHIIFIHHSDPESHMFKNLFGISCSSPNVICLIGHPDGKLLWSLCDSSNQFYSSLKLQTLYDIKQPVVGIFFVKDIANFEDCDFMLIVGVLGQVTLISSNKTPSFTLEPGNHPFWTLTAHLKPSIISCAVVKDCLLHFSSDGTLGILNLSVLLRPNQKSDELYLASSPSEFCCIEQMIVADKNQSLILLKTMSGNIYLTHLKKEVDSEAVTASLPLLMNDCLKQSNEMQELLNKKVLQSRLFATISTFASLKFSAKILKEPITFSLCEVNLEPRKYMLIINFKCLEKLRLDSELCSVTVTVFTYYESNQSLITKTAPYNVDEPTLCLEFSDTELQSIWAPIFPLFIEVGLILQLPNSWKMIDCFKIVSNWLPYYLCVQTFMAHELNLFQSSAICPPQSMKCGIPRTLKMIKELGLKRPISNILNIEPKKEYYLPKKFYICLLTSSVAEMKNTNDFNPLKYIESLLFGNVNAHGSLAEPYWTSKNSPISLSVSENNNYIVITLTANSINSLIGLRIAVMDILLSAYNKSNHTTSSSAYVSIPASIYRKCEDISKSLMMLFGKDVESDEVTRSIIQLYKEFRTEVSGKLPIL